MRTGAIARRKGSSWVRLATHVDGVSLQAVHAVDSDRSNKVNEMLRPCHQDWLSCLTR
jgi:hypothetical protein